MRVVSFFAGCGGLDIGFEQAGFDVVWANEFEPHCRATYLEQWGSGAKRMIDLCREQNVAEPEWEVENGSVKIVFWRPSILTDDSLNGSQSSNQNVSQNVRQ